MLHCLLVVGIGIITWRLLHSPSSVILYLSCEIIESDSETIKVSSGRDCIKGRQGAQIMAFTIGKNLGQICVIKIDVLFDITLIRNWSRVESLIDVLSRSAWRFKNFVLNKNLWWLL